MNTKTILRSTGVLLALGFTMTACGGPTERLPGSEDDSESGMADTGDDGWDDDDDDGADDDGADDDGANDDGADDDGADDDGADDDGGPAGTCGDAVVDPELGEQCDDGNDDDLDGCQNDCQFGPSELMIDYEVGSSLGAHGGGGGTEFSTQCDEGEVIIGMRGRSGSRVDRVQPQCGRLSMNMSESGSIEIEVEETEFLGQFGGGGGTEFHLECGENEIVVGFNGRSGAELDRLSLRCASLTLVSDLATGTLLTSYGEIDETFEVGGDGGSPFYSTCLAGEVVTQAFGRSGARVDSLGFTCRPLELI